MEGSSQRENKLEDIDGSLTNLIINKETPMKKLTAILVAIAAIGCESAEADNKENTAGSYNDYIYVNPVEMDLDDMEFENAFRVQYLAKGEGDTFWWRGDEYTTDLARDNDEFILDTINSNLDGLKWVLNNDDPDDDCYYNKRDECGVCNGDGKTTWFRDKDGDGLGDHREWIESCYNPNTDPNNTNLGSLD